MAGIDALAQVAVPSRAAVAASRDAKRDLDEALRASQASLAAAERDLGSRIKSHERRSREQQAVPAEELQRLRERREQGWSLVHRRYIENLDVAEVELHGFSGDQDLPQAYQHAVIAADVAADRRFEKAQIVRELAVMRNQIDETRQAGQRASGPKQAPLAGAV